MKYDFGWLGLTCLFGGLEAFWAGVTIEGIYPISISLGLTVLFGLIALSFLFAFLNSGMKEGKEEKE